MGFLSQQYLLDTPVLLLCLLLLLLLHPHGRGWRRGGRHRLWPAAVVPCLMSILYMFFVQCVCMCVCV